MREYKRINKNLYDTFRKFFPYSCVDIIVKKEEKFGLTRRTTSPYKGKWHIPGGIIRRNEKIVNAAQRIAREELGVKINLEELIGIYENIIPYRHDISHCFVATIIEKKNLKSPFTIPVKFFTNPPKNIIPIHRKMLNDAKQFF